MRPEPESQALELWCASFNLDDADDPSNGVATRIDLGGRTINAVHGKPHRWTADGRLLCKLVPSSHPSAPPSKPLAPTGPAIQEADGNTKKPARTYQDLLKDSHDEQLFVYYSMSELVLLQQNKSNDRWSAPITIGPTGGSLLSDFSPSPNSSCVMATTLIESEFSYQVPMYRFGRKREIWWLPPLDSDIAQPDATAVLLHSIPLQDSIPIGFDARPTGPRSAYWHPCYGSTLIWVEALDGGDPKAEPTAEGFRDMLYTCSVSATGANTADINALFGLSDPWAGWWFTEEGVGLIKEKRWKDRTETVWRLDRDSQRTKLWERMYQDAYTSPGSPEEVMNSRCEDVLQCIGSTASGAPIALFMGNGASPHGDRPFLDARSLEPNPEVKRLWRCVAGPLKGAEKEDPAFEVAHTEIADDARIEAYETPIYVLGKCADKLLLRREANNTPPNYFIWHLETGAEVQLTDFEHPQPQLAGTHTELIKYTREDGVSLTAQLYLPVGYDPKRDGPRPCLMWAYPQSFKDAKAAGQVKGSPYKFTRASWSRPTMWLAEGWVVLERFAMPILGQGDEEPNDTFAEQVVANAQAAVDEVCRRGVATRDRIAVGGHSYGAFMTAHLLAHSSLFAAGLARSGAYNRTLTPMGFQAEERDYWEVNASYT